MRDQRENLDEQPAAKHAGKRFQSPESNLRPGADSIKHSSVEFDSTLEIRQSERLKIVT